MPAAISDVRHDVPSQSFLGKVSSSLYKTACAIATFVYEFFAKILSWLWSPPARPVERESIVGQPKWGWGSEGTTGPLQPGQFVVEVKKQLPKIKNEMQNALSDAEKALFAARIKVEGSPANILTKEEVTPNNIESILNQVSEDLNNKKVERIQIGFVKYATRGQKYDYQSIYHNFTQERNFYKKKSNTCSKEDFQSAVSPNCPIFDPVNPDAETGDEEFEARLRNSSWRPW